MQDPVAVEVCDGRRELEQQRFDFRGEEGLRHGFLERFEIVFDEFEDDEYAAMEIC